MPDPISAYFENAQLSMAAYAALTPSIAGIAYKAALANAGFSDAQATGNGKRWETGKGVRNHCLH